MFVPISLIEQFYLNVNFIFLSLIPMWDAQRDWKLRTSIFQLTSVYWCCLLFAYSTSKENWRVKIILVIVIVWAATKRKWIERESVCVLEKKKRKNKQKYKFNEYHRWPNINFPQKLLLYCNSRWGSPSGVHNKKREHLISVRTLF